MPSSPAPYDEDLAYVQAVGFSGLAAGAMPAVVERLRAGDSAGRRVYDVGCGAGVSTRALMDAGFDVVGIEPSEALAAVARRAAPAVPIHVTTAHGFAFDRCDAILAIGEPLTYHEPGGDPTRRLQDFFTAAADALRAGGQLIFDVIETGTPTLSARGWVSGADWAVLFATAEHAPESRLVRTIETFREVGRAYRRSREEHHVALFDAEWIVATLDAAGFDVVTGVAYGAQALAARRRAFFATRRR
jgi:SAM-dependent methyltransferase